MSRRALPEVGRRIRISRIVRGEIREMYEGVVVQVDHADRRVHIGTYGDTQNFYLQDTQPPFRTLSAWGWDYAPPEGPLIPEPTKDGDCWVVTGKERPWVFQRGTPAADQPLLRWRRPGSARVYSWSYILEQGEGFLVEVPNA